MNRLDQELVRNCLQGSENAWEEFIRSHVRRVYSMSYRYTRCRAEAEDLTQDVFVRVYQTLNSYRGDAGSLSGWLMHVARNLLIDGYRKARRNVKFDPIRETELFMHDPNSPNPLNRLTQDETAIIVRAALQELAPKIRRVIELHDLEGHALCEVAAILHIPLGTVKSRMIRGRRELARILRRPPHRRPGPDRRLSERTQEPAEPRVESFPMRGTPARRMSLARRRTQAGNSLCFGLAAGGERHGVV